MGTDVGRESVEIMWMNSKTGRAGVLSQRETNALTIVRKRGKSRAIRSREHIGNVRLSWADSLRSGELRGLQSSEIKRICTTKLNFPTYVVVPPLVEPPCAAHLREILPELGTSLST